MKRILVILVILAFALGTAAYGQLSKAGVMTSDHNVGGNGCKSCHAPHNGSVATGGADQSTGTLLLWDRAISTLTYGTYSSPTMQNTAAEIGGSVPTATEPRLYSLLCMSCHDGVTTPGLVSGQAAVGSGNATTSSYGLRNDHPVNMSHNETNDPGLVAAATVATTLRLYSGGGSTNTVQCGSCHEPHNNTNSPFLRVSNASSGLCLSCHK